MSVADVLIDTRLAADTKRATRMDRPEDVDVNPVNGRVYACLTNNDLRGSTFPVDEPNPIGASKTRATLDGPLIPRPATATATCWRWWRVAATTTVRDFTWRLMLVCGDPEAPETYFAGFPKDKVSPISCPDNVAFDAEGNLWVSTDGNKLGSNDGLFRVPTAGPRRGQVRQFLTVPPGAETCGPVITRDQRRCSSPCSTRARTTPRRSRPRSAPGRPATSRGRRWWPPTSAEPDDLSAGANGPGRVRGRPGVVKCRGSG